MFFFGWRILNNKGIGGWGKIIAERYDGMRRNEENQ